MKYAFILIVLLFSNLSYSAQHCAGTPVQCSAFAEHECSNQQGCVWDLISVQCGVPHVTKPTACNKIDLSHCTRQEGCYIAGNPDPDPDPDPGPGPGPGPGYSPKFEYTNVKQIVNASSDAYFLHTEYGRVEFGLIQPTWWSGRWRFEKLEGLDIYRLRNAWKKNYLHVEYGQLEVGIIQENWHSALWTLEKQGSDGNKEIYVIRNYWTKELLKFPRPTYYNPGLHEVRFHLVDK